MHHGAILYLENKKIEGKKLMRLQKWILEIDYLHLFLMWISVNKTNMRTTLGKRVME